jgi:hypothetical protein
MTTTERKIEEFSQRKALHGTAEQKKRARMLERFSVINRFEGIVPDQTDRRLFELLASGKINKQEFLELCRNDALSH